MRRMAQLVLILLAVVLLPYSWPRLAWHWWRMHRSRARLIDRPSPLWSGDTRTLT